MRIWLEELRLRGVGGVQVHGICSRRLVYKEVVEVQSDHKKSYFWWCWLLRLNPGSWGEHFTSQLSWGAAWLLVTCGSPVFLGVDNELRSCVLWLLMTGLMMALLTFFDMVSMVLLIGSWCYSTEWVWSLRTKLCCIASGKWNVSRVSLQGLDTDYIMVQV